MVVDTCLLQLNWPTSFSLMRNCLFTCLAENRHGRTLNLQAMEFFPHRGWLFLLMRGLHLQARFLPELFRIGTVELLWGDGHSGKDWYRTVFILLMVLC